MNKLHMENPFYNLDSPEEKKEVKQEESILIPGLEGLLRRYEEMLELGFFLTYEGEKFLQTIDDILIPEQINAFLQSTIKYEEHERYQNNTAYFISKLIQNSYDAGYNDFVINTKTLKEISYLGSELIGTKNKPIEITIKGNTGEACGYQARHSTFHIEGNVGDQCGYQTEYCNFKIKGNVGRECGYKAKHSYFEIKGNTGRGCAAYAKNSFYIHENFGKDISIVSNNCTFITYKKEVYKRLLKKLFIGNKAILKDKNGKILKEKTISTST